MNDAILAVEIDGVAPGSTAVETIRVTNAEVFHSGDFTYAPFLQSGVDFEEDIFSKGTTSGDIKTSEGSLVLTNTGGDFDKFKFYGFDGRSVRVYRLEEGDQVGPDTLLLSLTTTSAEFELDEVTIKFKSRLALLDVPIQGSTFLGTNEGPEGLEGEEDKLKGKVKPMLVGQCLNVPAPQVNTSLGVYALNYDKDGNRAGVHSVWNVLDKGGEIFFQSDYATSALLIANPPAPGKYNTCLAEGLLMLGSTAVGDVTVDAYSAMGEDASAPRLVEALLTSVFGMTSGADYSKESLDRLHTLNSASVGYFVDESVNGLDVISALLDSIGAWMAPRLGVLHFGRIDATAGLSIDGLPEFNSDNIYAGSIKRIPTGDQGGGVPAKQVELKHTKLWKVLGKGAVLESIPTERAEYLSEEFRSVTVDSPPEVATTHLLAPSVSFETLLVKPRDYKLPKLLLSDVGLSPSNWDSVTAGGTSFVHVSTGAIGLTRNAVSEIDSAQATVYIGAGPSGATEELHASDGVLSFEYVSGPVDSSVFFQLSSIPPGTGALVELNKLGVYATPFTVGLTASYLILQLAGDGVGVSVIKNIRLTHRQYGLSPEEEAERRSRRLAADSERYEFEVPVKFGKDVHLGDLVALRLERFGLENGKAMQVIGKSVEYDDDTITLGVLG